MVERIFLSSSLWLRGAAGYCIVPESWCLLGIERSYRRQLRCLGCSIDCRGNSGPWHTRLLNILKPPTSAKVVSLCASVPPTYLAAVFILEFSGTLVNGSSSNGIPKMLAFGHFAINLMKNFEYAKATTIFLIEFSGFTTAIILRYHYPSKFFRR